MSVLYQGSLFNQYWWLILSISYLISFMELIVHDIPKWNKISFNTNLVIISSYIEVPENKHVSFLQLIHLIAMTSKCSLSPIQRNSNMSNNFNVDKISPLFVFIRFSVCYIMARKGNQSIASFIDVGKYESL